MDRYTLLCVSEYSMSQWDLPLMSDNAQVSLYAVQRRRVHRLLLLMLYNYQLAVQLLTHLLIICVFISLHITDQ